MKSRSSRGIRRALIVYVAIGLLALVALPASAITYEYDTLNRLIRVTNDDGGTVEYEYDETGNITRVIETPATSTRGKPEATEQAIDEELANPGAKQVKSSSGVNNKPGK